MTLRVLVGCEFSGVVREAFRAKGHDAWSCDLLPAADESPFHYQMDVLHVINEGWDLAIFHPPCTRLCNSGVRWLHERDLWGEMAEAAKFFKRLLDAPIPFVAVENPVMHRYAKDIIGRGPDFTVQPWQFGDNFKKRTCFWIRGLPPLEPTSDLDGSTAHAAVHLEPPGPDRWAKRSITYPGIARAMAEQWGPIAQQVRAAGS